MTASLLARLVPSLVEMQQQPWSLTWKYLLLTAAQVLGPALSRRCGPWFVSKCWPWEPVLAQSHVLCVIFWFCVLLKCKAIHSNVAGYSNIPIPMHYLSSAFWLSSVAILHGNECCQGRLSSSPDHTTAQHSVQRLNQADNFQIVYRLWIHNDCCQPAKGNFSLSREKNCMFNFSNNLWTLRFKNL